MKLFMYFAVFDGYFLDTERPIKCRRTEETIGRVGYRLALGKLSHPIGSLLATACGVFDERQLWNFHAFHDKCRRLVLASLSQPLDFHRLKRSVSAATNNNFHTLRLVIGVFKTPDAWTDECLNLHGLIARHITVSIESGILSIDFTLKTLFCDVVNTRKV
uniref:Uncharacterized protein n=1 Tax=Glossina austeni TaxID=7395 RepID=A0A1A9VN43_GLOAU